MPKGRHLWGQKGAKIDPQTTPKQNKIKVDFQERTKNTLQDHLGAVWGHLGLILGHLGRAWGHLEAILGRLGEPKTLIFLCFCSMIFANCMFRTKIVILASLEAFLGCLGAILGPLGTLLGLSWSSQEAMVTIGRAARHLDWGGSSPPEVIS